MRWLLLCLWCLVIPACSGGATTSPAGLAKPTITGITTTPATLRAGEWVTLHAEGNGQGDQWVWKSLSRVGLTPDIETSQSSLSLYVPEEPTWEIAVEAFNDLGSSDLQRFTLPVAPGLVQRQHLQTFESKHLAAGRYGEGLALVTREDEPDLDIWLAADPAQSPAQWRSTTLETGAVAQPYGIQVIGSTLGVLFGEGAALWMAVHPEVELLDAPGWQYIPLPAHRGGFNVYPSVPQLFEYPDQFLVAFKNEDFQLVLATAPAASATLGPSWQLMPLAPGELQAPTGPTLLRRGAARGFLASGLDGFELVTFAEGSNLMQPASFVRFPLRGVVEGYTTIGAFSDAWALLDHGTSPSRLHRIPALFPTSGSLVEATVLEHEEVADISTAVVYLDRPLLLGTTVEHVPTVSATTYFDLYFGLTQAPSTDAEWARITYAERHWTWNCTGCPSPDSDHNPPSLLLIGEALYLQEAVSFTEGEEPTQREISISRLAMP